MKTLDSNFYSQSTKKIARALLGAYIAHGKTIGRIVETEAYLYNNDPACHAHKGVTKRNAVMFGPPGHAYIYFIYGVHYCFNVVTGKEGLGEAVLIRALEPIAGISKMKERRKTDNLINLRNGPGKLVSALGLDISMNGSSLENGPIYILPKDTFPKKSLKNQEEIIQTNRIGISKAIDLPLRFYLKDNPFISKK